ncbi:MAG: class I tRNA ligase family protein [Parcubacteria group bacterium]|nr:class I tRNA ligase family protein [Parcubacteria group bacterium]
MSAMTEKQGQVQKEKEVLKFWENRKIFQKSLEQRKEGKRFVFFEGPPTANGKPGIHHFLGRAFKDLYGRYKTMRGFFVLRRAGWDTHGLPVEIEVEKELGFTNKKDIEEFGVAKFNKKAKESVWKYKNQWEEMTKSMGFWIDLENPYITYENKYIESVWWILKKLFDKKLLYQGHKILPYCTRCGTALSSHEVAQGYKDVTETSVYVKFRLKSKDQRQKLEAKTNALDLNPSALVYFLAWTTTPWTLPGNVALAVGKDIDYIKVVYNENSYGLENNYPKGTYIFAKDRANYFDDLVIWSQPKDIYDKYINNKISFDDIVNELKTIKGSDLVGLKYEPLFDIPALKSPNSYKIYPADFVTTEEGTGIVHTAVMYGEDDYELGKKVGLPTHHTVDEQGKFTDDLKEFTGQYVKTAEPEIIKYLDKNNLLFKVKEHTHTYPFCWRCNTPLLYYAKTSWFIKMSSFREQLTKNNQTINWIPPHLREGRFGEFLKEAKDWALSRERYWGTPLPIWKCVQCETTESIGSTEELEKKAVKNKNTYYLLRHGLTTRNEDKNYIVNSVLQKDSYHLTEEGKKQIETTVLNLKQKEKIDIIFSSPFLRTKESAEIAGKTFHHPIQVDERLREIGHGEICEGKTHAGPCPLSEPRKSFDDKHSQGEESWNDVRQRITEFVTEVESKYRNKKILVVSHADPLWLLKGVLDVEPDKNLLEQKSKGINWYPKLAELLKTKLKALPRNELGELDLHRPFVDQINLKCLKCKASMKRTPDLVDVWFDSGAMPYAQWHWPFENKKMFSQQFPADFIVEGIDQTRGWFYTLLAISTALDKKAPYKNVISLGHVLDEKGQKMSKSKGNVVSPFEIIEKFGADPARWYFYTLNQVSESKIFIEKDLISKINGFFRVLENSIRFYKLYSKNGPSTNADSTSKQTSKLLDNWLISKLNNLILEVSSALDAFDPTRASRAIEKFAIEDLSNWWIRRSRSDFQSDSQNKKINLLQSTLVELAKLIAPFTPFLAESIYKEIKSDNHPVESIHLLDWPKHSKRLINQKLEEKMNFVRTIVKLGLAAREKTGIKVRQPLNKLIIKLTKPLKLEGELRELIKDELNIKNIDLGTNPSTSLRISGEFTETTNEKTNPNLITITENEVTIILDTEITPTLRSEGWVREFIRALQDARKEAKYAFNQEISCNWFSEDNDLKEAIKRETQKIKSKIVLKEFLEKQHYSDSTVDRTNYDIERELVIESGRKIWFGLKT